MTRTVRRAGAALAALLTATLTLTGCLYSQVPEEAPAGSTPDPVTDGVAAELLPYYEQRLEWSPCAQGMECTTVVAPLDWENLGGDDIELALIRQPALNGQSAGALLVNPGGPGASGVDLVRDSVDYAAGEPLQQAFDIVGFDPRGVGQSSAVACYDAAEMDAFLYDIPAAPRGSDAWEAKLEAAGADFAAACDENSGGILPFVTTESSARDLDLLRAVLGDEKLHYLGYSYGAVLGANYAKLFPENVGRVVLDGPVDPALSGTEVGVVQNIGFENALRSYMASCLATDECPFRGSVDEAMSDVGALLAAVDRSPLPAADGRMLGADTLLTAILLPLYSESNWPALTDMFTDVLQGSAEYAFYLADLYYDRADGEYTTNSTEAFIAYNCMDYPVEDAEEAAAALERLQAEAPTLAPYQEGPDLCEQWPYPPTGVREAITAEGADPIVVVGTTGDSATPYEWAVSLADQLSSGTLITRVGEGHTGYNKGNVCVDQAVEAYFVDGAVLEDEVRCE